MDLLEKLKEVIDPELGLNIVDMGLIYEVRVENDVAKITMTLTTPTCPVGGLIFSKVEEVIRKNGLEPQIDLTFDPPWSPERMSPELRKRFNF